MPPFFIESEFSTLHLFRAPPSSYNQTTQSTHPLGGSTQSPEAKRAGFVSALKFAKALACGYSEAAGFIVLTEPSPWSFSLLLCCGARLVDAASARCVPRPRGCAHSAVPLGHTHPVPVGSPSAERAERAATGGGDDSSTASASCAQGAGPCTRLCPHSSSARHAPPYQQQQRHAATASGAGRRLLSTTKASAPPRRRRLPPPCGFSHRGSRERQRQWHTRDGTRTAARLRRGLLA